MHDAITVEHLSKTFDPAGFGGCFRRFLRLKRPDLVAAIKEVSLTVHRNEVYGVIGSNGSGKSTLARVIATLLIPDAGSVRVFGRDVLRDPLAVRRSINRVSVEASFWKKLSPLENLMFTARLYGVPAAAAKRRVYEILDRLGIEAASVTRPMDQMSRGMQQKVAVARALLTSPVLLIADEPTTGLDPRSKREVQAFVQEIHRTHDATVLLMTHDMDEATRLCNRLAVLDQGRILAEGPPASICQDGESLEDAFIRLTGHEVEGEDQARQAASERT